MLIGRILCRADIVNALETRLRVEETYKQHPAILDEPVDAPLFIIGLPRSGTSILHELLAQDPDHRAPLSWEARYPCPPPEEESFESDPRIERCESYTSFWNELVPEYKTMHEMGPGSRASASGSRCRPSRVKNGSAGSRSRASLSGMPRSIRRPSTPIIESF